MVVLGAQVVPDGLLYNLVLVAHIVAVMVGFGGLILARFGGIDGRVLANRVEWFAYSVPVLGVVVVLLSEDRWHFSQAWLGLGFAAWLLCIGVYQSVLRPARLGGHRPPRAATSAFDLLVVVAIALMVLKPGA
ncbi:MAG: hypothetical protein ACT4OS_03010 [Acidimicrobiales bacterium]